LPAIQKLKAFLSNGSLLRVATRHDPIKLVADFMGKSEFDGTLLYNGCRKYAIPPPSRSRSSAGHFAPPGRQSVSDLEAVFGPERLPPPAAMQNHAQSLFYFFQQEDFTSIPPHVGHHQLPEFCSGFAEFQ